MNFTVLTALLFFIAILNLCNPTTACQDYGSKLNEEIDLRRPIWNIAHMVNHHYELDHYLSTGANAIEADLQFHPNGTLREFYHGHPCDAGRACSRRDSVPVYLEALRSRSTPDSHLFKEDFILFYIDLKTDTLDSDESKRLAGQSLGDALLDHLFHSRDSQLRIIVEVKSLSDEPLLESFIAEFESRRASELFKDRIGFDVGRESNHAGIRKMYRRLKIRNAWQSRRVTYWMDQVNVIANHRRAIQSLIDRRDAPSWKAYQKVCIWTIDLEDNLHAAIE